MDASRKWILRRRLTDHGIAQQLFHMVLHLYSLRKKDAMNSQATNLEGNCVGILFLIYEYFKKINN